MISLYLFISIAVLSLLLVSLVGFYILKRKQKRERERTDTKAVPTFQELQEIIANDASSVMRLEQAAEDIIMYYGTIEYFDDYVVLIQKMCQHRNIKAKTIVQFEKALGHANPSYAKQIETIFQKALYVRG